MVLVIKVVAGVLFKVILFGLLLLLPAETWYWEGAITYLSVHLVLVMSASIYLAMYRPKAIEARLNFSVHNQPIPDRLATLVGVVALFGGVVSIPIDVFNWTVFASPSFAIKSVGLGMAILGLVLACAALAQNDYAEPLVNVQKDRGHILVDTGLYAYIRHPMYLGILIWLPGVALWLGSVFVATALVFLLPAAGAPRVRIEEETLSNDLEGYKGYVARVRYRLIPGLF